MTSLIINDIEKSPKCFLLSLIPRLFKREGRLYRRHNQGEFFREIIDFTIEFN